MIWDSVGVTFEENTHKISLGVADQRVVGDHITFNLSRILFGDTVVPIIE